MRKTATRSMAAQPASVLSYSFRPKTGATNTSVAIALLVMARIDPPPPTVNFGHPRPMLQGARALGPVLCARKDFASLVDSGGTRGGWNVSEEEKPGPKRCDKPRAIVHGGPSG